MYKKKKTQKNLCIVLNSGCISLKPTIVHALQRCHYTQDTACTAWKEPQWAVIITMIETYILGVRRFVTALTCFCR